MVPLYTYTLKSCADYGIYNDIYAQTALLMVILTFGMETTFFRFMNKEEGDKMRVYSTALIMVGSVCLTFAAMVLLFINPIASILDYSNHKWYVGMMFITVAQDAFQAIPFAYLRYKHQPFKFAGLKLLFIFLSVTLNIVAYWLMPKIDPQWEIHIGYAFVINLACTTFISFCLISELLGFRWRFDKEKCKAMLRYSWPLLVLGIAGILNQVAGQILLPRILEPENGRYQLGIYGACIKIAMIMALITQAFRFAYEPIVFGSAKDKNSKELYAKSMKFFIIFTLLAFLCVMGYIEIFKYLVGEKFREGLGIVPIVMMAEIMMGVYFNLSFWYKLIDKTIYGAWFSLTGCAVLFAVNIIFIPKIGYWACAWGGVAGYGTAMILSYIVGQRKNPIPYPVKDIVIYFIAAMALFGIMKWGERNLPYWASFILNNVLILGFIGRIIKADMPLSSLPVIGKKFKKK
jgi:O-antigen/teichoic acid export membrane protein